MKFFQLETAARQSRHQPYTSTFQVTHYGALRDAEQAILQGRTTLAFLSEVHATRPRGERASTQALLTTGQLVPDSKVLLHVFARGLRGQVVSRSWDERRHCFKDEV